MDINSDGILDILGFTNPQVNLYLGESGFQPGGIPVLGFAGSLSLVQPVPPSITGLDIADWNSDGLLDAVVSTGNHVYVYLNSGTPQQFECTGGFAVQVAGAPLDLLLPKPWFGDADGDGLGDLFVGYGLYHVAYLRNSGTASDPLFDTMLPVVWGADSADVDEGDSPTLCDWNGDGIPDLMTGDLNGYLFVYPGLGTSGVPGGEAEPSAVALQVLTNPCSGELRISLVGPADRFSEVRLFDTAGRLAASYPVLASAGTGMTLDVSGVPSGVYLVIAGEGPSLASATAVIAR